MVQRRGEKNVTLSSNTIKYSSKKSDLQRAPAQILSRDEKWGNVVSYSLNKHKRWEILEETDPFHIKNHKFDFYSFNKSSNNKEKEESAEQDTTETDTANNAVTVANKTSSTATSASKFPKSKYLRRQLKKQERQLRKDQQMKKKKEQQEEEDISNTGEQKNCHLFYLNHKRQGNIYSNNIGQDVAIILTPSNKCLNNYTVPYPYESWYMRREEYETRIQRNNEITKELNLIFKTE